MTAAAVLSNEDPAGGGGGDQGVVLVETAATISSTNSAMMVLRNSRQQPAWLEDESVLRGERLVVPEWDIEPDGADDGNNSGNCYRRKHGWLGRDLVHDRQAPVRITDYFVRYGSGTDIRSLVVDHHPQQQPHGCRGGAGTTLTGVVEFTAAAESHAGCCHGGAACSVMDDCVGWAAFCVTGACRPWTGYTVQINTALRRAVPVRATLAVVGRVTAVERRKVSVAATLYDPAAGTADDPEAVHAACEGLVVLNRGILKTE